MKRLLLLLCFLLPTLAHPQRTDPLAGLRRQLAAARADTTRGRLFWAMSELTDASDSIIYFAQRAVPLLQAGASRTTGAEQQRVLRLLGGALNNLAVGYQVALGDDQRARPLLRQAAQLRARVGDTHGQVEALDNLGECCRRIGDYAGALQAFREGVQAGEAAPDKLTRIRVAYCLQGIARVSEQLGDAPAAVRAGQQALRLIQATGDSTELAQVLGTLATTLLHTGGTRDTAQVEAYARRAQHLFEAMGTGGDGQAYFATELRGRVRAMQQRWPQARTFLLRAHQQAGAAHDLLALASTAFHLAQLELATGHQARALGYAQQAVALADKSGVAKERADAHQLLSRLYEQQQQPQLALAHYRQYATLRDSLRTEETRKSTYRQLVRFEYERKEATLKAQQAVAQAEIRRQKVLRYASWAGAALLLLLAAVLYQRYRLQQRLRVEALQKEKAQVAQQLLETELKALRAQMNPHFLFNCLNSIQAFILKENRRDATDYLQRFARLIRLTLENSRKTTTTLEDEAEILDLYLGLEQLRLKGQLSYEIVLPPDLDPSFTEFPSLVVQPLVENSIWHGLMPAQRPGHVRVAFEKLADGLRCVVEDNGIGRAEAARRKGSEAGHISQGLRLLEDRLRAWAATRAFTCAVQVFDGEEAGTRTEIRLEYAPAMAG